MATHGYSTLTLQAINDANPFLLGVKLAKICVRLNIPVKDVAEYLNVSRPTVYSWFIGKSEVSKKHQEQVQKLIEKLA
jgi:transcriptional regulator with XRE-family HTH domain